MKRGFQQTMNMVMALALSVAGVGCGSQGLDPVGGDGIERDVEFADNGSENQESSGEYLAIQAVSVGSTSGDDIVDGDGSENDESFPGDGGEAPDHETICATAPSGNEFCCYWSTSGKFLACYQ